jgi:hypothetical protein
MSVEGRGSRVRKRVSSVEWQKVSRENARRREQGTKRADVAVLFPSTLAFRPLDPYENWDEDEGFRATVAAL